MSIWGEGATKFNLFFVVVGLRFSFSMGRGLPACVWGSRGLDACGAQGLLGLADQSIGMLRGNAAVNVGAAGPLNTYVRQCCVIYVSIRGRAADMVLLAFFLCIDH